jgi:hypothetical protein
VIFENLKRAFTVISAIRLEIFSEILTRVSRKLFGRKIEKPKVLKSMLLKNSLLDELSVKCGAISA